MIGNPVKGCRAEDALEYALKGKVLQIGCDEFNASGELRKQVFSGNAKHVAREVQCHDLAFGQ